jgi:predicted SnoaL-like aldol condensation-catalyzing enzyme
MSASLRTMIEDFADLFYRQRNPQLAFERHVADGYIQHSPRLLDGREAALAMLEPLFSQQGGSFVVHKIIIDDPLVVIHLHARPDGTGPGLAVADFYRVADGKIVEHWDVIQPVPAEAANPRSMIA